MVQNQTSKLDNSCVRKWDVARNQNSSESASDLLDPTAIVSSKKHCYGENTLSCVKPEAFFRLSQKAAMLAEESETLVQDSGFGFWRCGASLC